MRHSTSLMSVKTASQPIPALLGFTSNFGYFRSTETDQRENKKLRTSSPALDVAANTFRTAQTVLLLLFYTRVTFPFIFPKTSK